ncbi:hypothetical protein A3L09_06465 [Thermococcus profundus]|uniref:Uncharacterized protein n=1 Tax=Thermococcus profundus TaxID=49899 RepID=A0A2Z2MBP0_THEPR|nr:hypothetical protein A3L09_06465 [Thermococcus profundus]
MGGDPFSGIGDSFEDAIGFLLISLLAGIFGMIFTILANVAIQMNIPEATSWTLRIGSLYLLMIGYCRYLWSLCSWNDGSFCIYILCGW